MRRLVLPGRFWRVARSVSAAREGKPTVVEDAPTGSNCRTSALRRGFLENPPLPTAGKPAGIGSCLGHHVRFLVGPPSKTGSEPVMLVHIKHLLYSLKQVTPKRVEPRPRRRTSRQLVERATGCDSRRGSGFSNPPRFANAFSASDTHESRTVLIRFKRRPHYSFIMKIHATQPTQVYAIYP